MDKIDYDFIEIGTADFDTVLQTCPNDNVGISVEPIRTYLNRLPNKPKVNKVCAALVTEKQYAESPVIDVYYVKEEVIRERNLGDWMKGCNSVGKPHDFHIRYFHNPSIWHHATPEERQSFQTVDLLERGIVTIEKVECLTYRMLFEQYGINQVHLLKTDTEGQDAALLIDIMSFYLRNELFDLLPKKIQFEDNDHSNKLEMLV